MVAGQPITSAKGGTSAVTTAPAATMQWRPSLTPQTIVAFAPTLAPRSNTVSEICQSLLWERGSRSRSEEHTSELQSLMRISYAVFCLKKKKQRQSINNYKTTSTRQTYK